MPAKLKIAEQFYSIQGEGPTAGIPAVFLRLSGCNLGCPGFSYVDPQTGDHLGCDTKAVWKHGTRLNLSEILLEWENAGWIEAMRTGAHLVITGGEPLLQQAALAPFLHAFQAKEGFLPYIELETNGTISPEPSLIDLLSQINASPKLFFCGESKSKRYCPVVLDQLAAIPYAVFKFVVRNTADINEVLRDYVTPFRLPPRRIFLMPEGGTRAQVEAHSPTIVEACKQYGFRYSPRLQITIWEAATGV
jgi:6-pyruvoyltetrahydropterin 2'-reductase